MEEQCKVLGLLRTASRTRWLPARTFSVGQVVAVTLALLAPAMVQGVENCDTSISSCIVTGSALASMGTTQAASQFADTTPPMLISIAVSPTSVDVSAGSSDITVTVHLTDDSSGVVSWSTTFVSPSGLQSLTVEASPGLVTGTLTDGTFSGMKTLAQGSEQGAWTASTLTATDVAGNTVNINLSTFGIFLIQVGPSKEDVTPPDLVSIEVTPTTVDVTAGDATVTVSAHLTDDLSGAQRFDGSFLSPSGHRAVSFWGSYLASGTSLNGVFQAWASFPQFTEAGIWRPQTCSESSPVYREFPCVYVYDRVGNQAQIDLQAKGITLEVQVISPPEDVTPPDLTSIGVTPMTVDVTAADATDVTVQAHLTDDLSGAAYFDAGFQSPSGRRYASVRGYLDSGNSLDGVFQGTLYYDGGWLGGVSFPQYTEPGVWRPQNCYESIPDPPGYRQFPCVYVYDRVGNLAQIDLQAKAIDLKIQVTSPVEDVTPPELLAIGVKPTAVDISAGDGTIAVQTHLTDDLSGAQRFDGSFLSPSGRHSAYFYGFLYSGTASNGTFQATAFFPQYTEPGVWRPQTCYESPAHQNFPCVYVYDRVGNYAPIDLQALGTPLQLGVLSVKPGATLTLEPASAQNPTGSSHTLTATLTQGGLPVQNVKVTFDVIDGPNQGTSDTAFTDADGKATFTYTGTTGGVDTIVASVDIDGDGEVDAARQATKEWTWVCQAPCADLPPINCTEQHPCDVLAEGAQCPGGAKVTTDSAELEQDEGQSCPGGSFRVIRTRSGQFTRTAQSNETVCGTECMNRCFDTCVAVPVQHCYQVCVRRCTNGVCWEWKTQCEVELLECGCNTGCFEQCQQNFDPVTRTSFFNQQCGFPIADTIDVRVSNGACTGTTVSTHVLSGAGTVAANLPLPLTPGTYDVCLGSTLLRTITVSDCGVPACSLTVADPHFVLTQGQDASLPVGLRSVPMGGTFNLSLHRFQDNAHTVPLSVPSFLAVPSQAVSNTSVMVSATNPQPLSGQTHWANVLLTADGPATCSVGIDVDVSEETPPVTQTPTTTPAPGGPTPTPTVPLCPGPQLSVQPPSPHDFGSVPIGYRGTFAYKAENTGCAPLTGTVTAPCAGFSVDPSNLTLYSGQQTNVRVTFAPPSVGSFTCQLTFNTNGGNLELALNGVGLPPPPIPVIPSPLSPAGLALITGLGLSMGWILRKRWRAANAARVGSQLMRSRTNGER